MKLRINTIDYKGSIVDGPGIRTVLFVQGCDKHCPGCHNPCTWDRKDGIELEIEEIISNLRKKCHNKKLTISGGEPLLQYPTVLELVKSIQDFDIALYTGFEIEDVPSEIFQYIKYLKVGSYIEKKRTTITPYIGSANQKFIRLKDLR